MRHLVGIDIGTQGVKAAVYGEDGLARAEAFRASHLHRPGAGMVEEDPEFQVRSSLEVVREAVERAKISPADVAAIGIAGQMAGVIGIGEDGRALTHYDSWLDTRCGAYVRRMHQEAGDEIIERAGNPPSFNHGPKILWWKHERESDYRRIRAFVQPGGYVAMRLCALGGSEAFIDTTYLHFSGFADNRKAAWDADLCRRFDVDPAKLPRIVEPETIVGHLDSSVAPAAGLPAGIPIVAGCGDTAASFLSCGATQEGICVDVAGTASVFAATTREFVADTVSQTLGCGRSVIPGLWHPYAYINGGGQNLEWFRRTVLQEKHTLDELNRWAADASQDQAMPYFVPHLGGRVSPNWPHLRGGWMGLDWDTKPGMLYRSMLESVALEYGLYQRTLRRLLPDFDLRQIRITGGGEKSHVWNQLKADRLQAEVVGIARSGGAPMGAALLAGCGAGLFDNLAKTAGQWVELGRSTQPDRSAAALANRRIDRYAALLEAMNAWSEAGADR